MSVARLIRPYDFETDFSGGFRAVYRRKELERGVRVENYQKLTALIEDYIS